MITAAKLSSPTSTDDIPWHAGFVGLLPDIERHAQFALRGLAAEQREEAVQEVLASACCAYHRLFELGKTPLAYPSVLARHGVAQYRCGRRVGNPTNRRDLLSPHPARRKGLRVRQIGTPHGARHGWQEALTDNRRTPVPDQAAFRIDFPAWLGGLPVLKRRVAQSLALGHRTRDVATAQGITPGRVSQLRRELHRSWQEFHNEEVTPSGLSRA